MSNWEYIEDSKYTDMIDPVRERMKEIRREANPFIYGSGGYILPAYVFPSNVFLSESVTFVGNTHVWNGETK